MNKVLLLLLIIISNIAQADIYDDQLKLYIERFNLKSLSKISDANPRLTQLGKKLFEDKRLSLAGDISCKSCHNSHIGTGDGLPLSLGTGAVGEGHNRNIKEGNIIPRNAPSLYNKGRDEMGRMFWDGRIRKFPRDDYYTTPIEEFNGELGLENKIVQDLSGILAMQALFPMISKKEMLGEGYDHLSPFAIWNKITQKILSIDYYRIELESIFDFKDISIAHIANAIAHFQKITFQATNTPYDEYLNGNKNILSINEKKGFLVFAEKGRCIRCHFGPLLTNQSLQNVVVPSIGPGTDGRGNDRGHYDVNHNEKFKYRFVTSPLRNVKKTAPYFHNGSVLTLTDVVNHYNRPFNSIDEYDGRIIANKFIKNYGSAFRINRNPYTIFAIKENKSPLIKISLNLNPEEKRHLVLFLERSLTNR